MATCEWQHTERLNGSPLPTPLAWRKLVAGNMRERQIEKAIYDLAGKTSPCELMGIGIAAFPEHTFYWRLFWVVNSFRTL